MKPLIFVVVFGSCLLSLSHGYEKLPQESDSTRTARAFQMKDFNLMAALDVRTNAYSSWSIKTVANDCSISDQYGSCTATCGAGKGVCKPGYMVVEDLNKYGMPSRTRDYPPSCSCAGPAGPESCGIQDQFGSCSVAGDKGKAVCKPGYLIVEDLNIYGMPSKTRAYPPSCRFNGQGASAESCSIRDPYGSCNATCDKDNAVCKPGYMVVLDLNKYGMPSRTEDHPPSCGCVGQPVRKR